MDATTIIPICCVCNRVRDGAVEDHAEQWDTLGSYLKTYHLSSGDYQLTHTYCPACATLFSRLRKTDEPVPSGKSSRSMPEENVTATILDVFAGVQKCDLDMLVRACPSLTWNQIFSEVDRLSRTGQLHLSYLGHGRYSIELPRGAEAPLVTQT
ncbi:MAG: exported protein of unknown function [Nitrospira sp.]|jgi:hypothetical protein|nr:exported protein of unknown function [Nitrospira sp.]